jgi:hypothetical protein
VRRIREVCAIVHSVVVTVARWSALPLTDFLVVVQIPHQPDFLSMLEDVCSAGAGPERMCGGVEVVWSGCGVRATGVCACVCVCCVCVSLYMHRVHGWYVSWM